MFHPKLVQSFTAHMLGRLYANDDRNGGGGQYRPARDINTVDPESLRAMFVELRQNVACLEAAVLNEGSPLSPNDQIAATVECAADVANIAMLIAYDSGAIKPMPPKPHMTDDKIEKAFIAGIEKSNRDHAGVWVSKHSDSGSENQ